MSREVPGRSPHAVAVATEHKAAGYLPDLYTGHARLSAGEPLLRAWSRDLTLLWEGLKGTSTFVWAFQINAHNNRLAVAGGGNDEGYGLGLMGAEDIDVTLADDCFGATPDDDDGYIFGHDAIGTVTAIVRRYTSAGVLDWTYDPGTPGANTLSMKSDGGVIVGNTVGGSGVDDLVALDSDGNLDWSNRLGTTIRDVECNASTGYVYCAGERITTPANRSLWVFTQDVGSSVMTYDTGNRTRGCSVGVNEVVVVGDTSGGANVWSINRGSPVLRWSIDLGGIMTGVSYSPHWNTFFVTGTRNNSWPGAGGSWASIWALDTDGDILATADPDRGSITACARW